MCKDVSALQTAQSHGPMFVAVLLLLLWLRYMGCCLQPCGVHVHVNQASAHAGVDDTVLHTRGFTSTASKACQGTWLRAPRCTLDLSHSPSHTRACDCCSKHRRPVLSSIDSRCWFAAAEPIATETARVNASAAALLVQALHLNDVVHKAHHARHHLRSCCFLPLSLS
jgi:hypothetical protein